MRNKGPILALITASIFICLPVCFAQSDSQESILANNVDLSIFIEAERHFLLKRSPTFKVPSVDIQAGVLNQKETEITLREIELKKFESESDEEFVERAEALYSELIEHPENFQEKARTLSASRSRFRSGLLTPLTLNQLDAELATEVTKLESSQLSKPIRIGDSIFILRREPTRI